MGILAPKHIRSSLNILRSEQNGRHIIDSMFKCISSDVFFYFIQTLLRFCSCCPIVIRAADKLLRVPMMTASVTDICVMKPQTHKVAAISIATIMGTLYFFKTVKHR